MSVYSIFPTCCLAVMEGVPVRKVGPLTTPQEVTHSLAGDVSQGHGGHPFPAADQGPAQGPGPNSGSGSSSITGSGTGSVGGGVGGAGPSAAQIQAYAMLDFDSFTFYVQTMHIMLGRMVDGEGGSDALDIHLGSQKAISRRHAKIYYNFGNQRFELSVLGRNGAFVDEAFVEKGVTVPLHNGSKVQIGETGFVFELPGGDSSHGPSEKDYPASISVPRKGKNRLPSISEADIMAIKSLDSVRATGAAADLEKDIDKDIHKEIEKVLADHKDSKFDKDLAMALQENSKSPPPQIGSEGSKKTKAPPPAKKAPKQKKKVYAPEEIPVQYREKPPLSYSTLITECLRKTSSHRGMSLSEIYKAIQDAHPYYHYAADGWQSSVRHNLSLNKSFQKISKEGKGWLWGLDEEVIAEKERVKEKQIETAKAKVKTMQTQQKAREEVRVPAAVAAPAVASGPAASSAHASGNSAVPATQQLRPAASTPVPPASVNDNTKRALSYLQQELIQLTKNRYNNFDKGTTTEILTQALAMTINQVGQAAKSAGIKGSPLVTLIDKNPQHITKILTAALNAATLQITRKKGLPNPPLKPTGVQPKPIAPKPEKPGPGTPGGGGSGGGVPIRLQPAKNPNKPMIHTFTKPMQFTKPLGTPMKIKPIKPEEQRNAPGAATSAAATAIAATPSASGSAVKQEGAPAKPHFYSKAHAKTSTSNTSDLSNSVQPPRAGPDLSQMLDTFISDNSPALAEGINKRPHPEDSHESPSGSQEPPSKIPKPV